MIFVGAVLLLVVLVFLVVGNGRYGRPASQWTTPGQRVAVWVAIAAAVVLVLVYG